MSEKPNERKPAAGRKPKRHARAAAAPAEPGRSSKRAIPAAATPLRAGAVHRATVRLLQLQELFASSPLEGQTLTELSRQLNVPKSSLLAILRTLRERGYLELTRAGEYQLGPKAIEMSRDVWLKSPIHKNLLGLAHSYLVDLQDKTGEAVFLGVPQSGGTDMVYVDHVESSQLIRYSGGVGEHRPLYCSASGIAFLSFLPLQRQEEYLRAANLVPLTPRTLTNVERLRMRLEEVRRTGVAISIEEFVTGASAIAAPIFGREGGPVAACSLAGPTDRILAQRERIVQAVKSTASSISQALGYQARPQRTATRAGEAVG